MNNRAKPFVKWVGGKTQLLSEVEKALPNGFADLHDLTYVEPFVGGGAVLFWILQRYSNIKRAVINDINSELITTYNVVKYNVLELIKLLGRLQDEYLCLDMEGRKAYFSNKRDFYNQKDKTELETAALFIFLNKTCFNGLYRVNSKGQFNVPHGRYFNPKICDSENLSAVSTLLQKVEILCGDFAQTERFAKENALFYLDPPYRPITATSSFTSYSKDGFDDSEQVRLKNFCSKIADCGAMFLASNSDSQDIDPSKNFLIRLYKQFSIKRVYAPRMINANPDRRGRISELMISNVINY